MSVVQYVRENRGNKQQSYDNNSCLPIVDSVHQSFFVHPSIKLVVLECVMYQQINTSVTGCFCYSKLF